MVSWFTIHLLHILLSLRYHTIFVVSLPVCMTYSQYLFYMKFMQSWWNGETVIRLSWSYPRSWHISSSWNIICRVLERDIYNILVNESLYNYVILVSRNVVHVGVHLVGMNSIVFVQEVAYHGAMFHGCCHVDVLCLGQREGLYESHISEYLDLQVGQFLSH